jgi:hypothetical protein
MDKVMIGEDHNDTQCGGYILVINLDFQSKIKNSQTTSMDL